MRIWEHYAELIAETIPNLAWEDVKKEAPPDQAFSAAAANFIWWLLRKERENSGRDG